MRNVPGKSWWWCRWSLFGLVAALIAPAAGAAAICVEVGDAGDLAPTAQSVLGTGLVAAIRGHLDGDVDVYRLVVTGTGGFSATTALSGAAFNNFDMALYLFDEQGRGVYANDDDAVLGPWSLLPAGHALTPLAPGIYHLAIAGAGTLPVSLGGAIFPMLGGLLDGTSDVLGPTGPGGAAPLVGWTAPGSDIGAYEIVLTGAEFMAVPEPPMTALIALALFGAAFGTRRRLAAFAARPAGVRPFRRHMRSAARAVARARGAVLAATLTLAAALAHAQYAKLDAALSDVVDGVAAAVPGADYLSEAILDTSGRILVDVHLDGSLPLSSFAAQLASLGAQAVAAEPSYRHGMLSVFVPVSALRSLAAAQGVHVIRMTWRPEREAGTVRSQGATVIRSVMANGAGVRGRGITVGVVSDSYDRDVNAATHAADDERTGDLSVPKLVLDAVPGDLVSDEGRAMMQIVQDVAPEALLCFASGWQGEAAFATAIRTLRTHADCRADVIVDDLTFPTEPFFSDGVVARAVNDVVTSSTMPGRPVAYFAAAGNRAGAIGRGSIDVPARFSATPAGLGNIDLSTIAGCTASPAGGGTRADAGGGWLDFGGGVHVLPVTLTGGGLIVMQWDDVFFGHRVTTDLNWYLFDANGRCVRTAATDNIAEDQAAELVRLNALGTFAGRMMVARTSAGTQAATRVRLLNFRGGFASPAFGVVGSPTLFGHKGAAGAIAVAAYAYTAPFTQQSPFMPAFENFSSPGPVAIMFDAADRRLPLPEMRKKPELAAPDGVDTTFFGDSDDEGSGLPNFFGTSAAAPHAAGAAALLMQRAGGPGRLSPQQVRSMLQTTTPARRLPHGGAALVRTWSPHDGFGLIDVLGALSRVP